MFQLNAGSIRTAFTKRLAFLVTASHHALESHAVGVQNAESHNILHNAYAHLELKVMLTFLACRSDASTTRIAQTTRLVTVSITSVGRSVNATPADDGLLVRPKLINQCALATSTLKATHM